MKKLIIAMSIIAFAFSSCQKKSHIISTTDHSSSELLSTDARHFYQGKQVNYQSEISCYHSTENAILFTDKISGTLEYYYFDNEIQELKFLNETPILKPIYEKLLQAIEAREFALTSGTIERYNESGILNDSYIKFIQKYKSRGFYTVFSNVFGMASTALFIPAGGIPAFPLAMDNNAESYNSMNGQGLVFRNPFYLGGSFAIFITAGQVNFPPIWRNIISSAW